MANQKSKDMKKIKISFALLVALFIMGGCTYQSEDVRPDPPTEVDGETVRCKFTMHSEPMREATRAMSENSVGMVQGWLYNAEGSMIQAAGSWSTGITNIMYANLIPGDTYYFAAVANGPDVTEYSGNTLEKIQSLYLDTRRIMEGMVIPMAYFAKVEVPYMYGRVYEYPVMLERMLAKINFTVKVDEYAEGITLQGVEICNVPEIVKVIPDVPIPDPHIAYRDIPTDIRVTEQNTITGTVYLPENLQGTVDGIELEEQRTREQAPAKATYLHIVAATDGGRADYYVYLGENNTTDFNVCRNTIQNCTVTIMGSNSSDLRVSSYHASLYDATSAKYQQVDRPFGQMLEIFSTDRAYDFSLRLECEAGDWQYMTAAGQPFTDGICELGQIPITGEGYVRFDTDLRYSPPMFTTENRDVVIRYVITDNYGFETDIVQTYQCANVLRIYSSRDDWKSLGAVSYNEFDWLTEEYRQDNACATLYSYDNPLAATAIPQQGQSFLGWYSDTQMGNQFALTEKIRLLPDGSVMELYPVFSEPTYMLVFKPNGGEGQEINLQLSGNSYEIQSPEDMGISRYGYRFVGWYKNPDGWGDYYTPGMIVFLNDTLTLYAVWSEIPTYEITYNADGGTGSFAETIFYDAQPYTLRSPEDVGISREGDYVFNGWSTESGKKSGGYHPGGIMYINKNTTLYAAWQPIYKFVTYHPNGSTGGFVDRYDYGSRYRALGQYEAKVDNYPGYAFMGWEMSYNPPIGNKSYYRKGQEFSTTGDLNLYAVWWVGEVYIEYHPNGGTGQYKVDYVKGQDHKFVDPETAGISRTGYRFIGWGLDPDRYDVDYTPGKWLRLQKNVSVHAIWVPE